MKKILPAILFGLVYGLLILLGWDWTFSKLHGFFSHPARTIVFIVTVLVNISTMLLKDKFNVEFFKKGEKQAPKEKIIGLILPTLIGFLMVFIAPFSESHDFFIIGGGDIIRYIGLILFLIGYIFMIWGPLHLGKQFSFLISTQKEHKLITDGPFKIIRHPRYSGIIFWIFGFALVFPCILSLILASIMSSCILYRIPKEEKTLHEVFKEDWENFCKRTPKKLIPFIY